MWIRKQNSCVWLLALFVSVVTSCYKSIKEQMKVNVKLKENNMAAYHIGIWKQQKYKHKQTVLNQLGTF